MFKIQKLHVREILITNLFQMFDLYYTGVRYHFLILNYFSPLLVSTMGFQTMLSSIDKKLVVIDNFKFKGDSKMSVGIVYRCTVNL